MSTQTIAVFVPFLGATPRGDPTTRPLGRLALSLHDEGIELVFSTLEQVHGPGSRARKTPAGRAGSSSGTVRTDGMLARPSGWVPVHGVPVDAGYVRVASLRRLTRFPEVAAVFRGLMCPLVNTPALLALCRDKLEFAIMARQAGLPVPETVADPTRMVERMETWQRAYFKPRFGARGRGVALLQVERGGVAVTTDQDARFVSRADLANWIKAATALEPMVLQRAIPLPDGRYTAVSIRSLVQRDANGRWVSRSPVVRLATSGVAGNVSAGAEVKPLLQAGLSYGNRSLEEIEREIHRIDAAVAAAIDTALGPLAPLAAEVGIDYVPDPQGRLWVIEANDTPQGRLGHVARQAGPDSLEARACAEARAAPIRYLAARPESLLRACGVAWSTAGPRAGRVNAPRGPLESFWPVTGG